MFDIHPFDLLQFLKYVKSILRKPNKRQCPVVKNEALLSVDLFM